MASVCPFNVASVLVRYTPLTLQIIQQRAVLHQLCNNVDRLLDGAHGVQLDQFAVPQLLHDLCLGQKVLWIHRTRLQCLDRNWCRIVPQALPHIAELPRAKLSHKLQGAPIDLPLVTCPVRQSLRHRFLDLQTRHRISIKGHANL